MLVLVVGRLDHKTARVSGHFFEYGDKVPDDRSTVVIDLGLFFCAFNFCRAVNLDGKPDPTATGMIGREPVHVKHGKMYPCRGFHDYFPFRGFQLVGRLFSPEGLQVLSRRKWIKLVFYDLNTAIQNIFKTARLDNFFTITTKEKLEKEYL